MSKSFELQGRIHSIGETQSFGNNGFTKREFVIQVTGPDENPAYPNYAQLELIKDKCALMDNFKLGDEIQATFNISGRLWAGNGGPERCFTSLQAWRVQPVGAAQQAPQQQYAQPAMQAAPQAAAQPQAQQAQAPSQANNPFGQTFSSDEWDDDIPF